MAEIRLPESYYQNGQHWQVDTKEKFYHYMLHALLDARKAGAKSVTLDIIEDIINEADLNFGSTDIKPFEKP